ncbi:MAG: DNA mismatch repair protein MutS [Deltaproteobacteria bacterium]|nr:DNA mismatch repair protein MutS [Deltaproteobacteria bacterium]
MATVTPMMRQYLEAKAQHPDAILFFRMGDFYEMFLEDAVVASRALDIALTSRNRGEPDEVPMCGIPVHASRSYINKMVAKGFKVAVCDQVEDPKSAKGLVRREVVRIVTPGLNADAEALDPRENNYLMGILAAGNGSFGCAWLDLSTGEFRVAEFGEGERLRSEVVSVGPREVLIPEGEAGDTLSGEAASWLPGAAISRLAEWRFETSEAVRTLEDFFHCGALDSFGCADLSAAVRAAGGVIRYLLETHNGAVSHIRPPQVLQNRDCLVLDDVTRRNLELSCTLQGGKRRGSLLGVLDRTETAMGGRKLYHWLNYPLLQVAEIQRRQEAVQELFENSALRAEIRQILHGISDLERLNARISLGNANPRELLGLASSLERTAALPPLLGNCSATLLQSLGAAIDSLPNLRQRIVRCLSDQPPLGLKEGGIIRDGFNAALDELRSISRDGKGWISRLERQERERTGIPSLKIRFNRVFGYFIEVTKAHLHLVPDDFFRKQTLSNAERYITEALKGYEEKVLRADERIIQLEYDLFQQLRQEAGFHGPGIQGTAEALAEVDVLAALAEVAQERDYVRPVVDDGEALMIRDGRHPVVEAMNLEERFVPNDLSMSVQEEQILILTGPNMAGKSTFMRQVALIVLLAQIGAFVPAAEARIGVVDRIFTRVGASDNLGRGHSTFMVEMIETAHILHHATPKSLVLLDEIGRGTSTFDGLSIAWSVVEFLHDAADKGAKTLFATHYHELAELALTRRRVKNFNIAVKEWDDRIIFLRKIVAGSASHSYGIQVARLAGLPAEVITRAREILSNLEGSALSPQGEPKLALSRKNPRRQRESAQLSLFASVEERLRQALEGVEISTMTPLEAINFLDQLKRMV